MPPKLGRLIRQRRLKKKIGLREFARLIGKSPTFAVMLEKDENVSVSEGTLLDIARVLELKIDELLAAAQKLPENLKPRSELELALFRKVRKMTKKEKEDWIQRMSEKGR